MKNDTCDRKTLREFIVVTLVTVFGFFSCAFAQNAEFAGGEDVRPAFSSAVPDGIVEGQQRIERKRYLRERAYAVPPNHTVAAYYPTWAAGTERNFTPSQVPVEQLSDIIVAYGAICGRNIVAYRQGARINRACENPSGFNPQNPDGGLGWYYLPEFMEPLQENEATLINNIDLYFNQQFVSREGRFRGLLPAMIDWKNRNPHLKVHWAIGGWSYSGPFYKMTASPESRRIFVLSLKKWLSQPVMHFVDGISIDWEAPGGGAADGDLGNPGSDGRNLVLLMQELRQMLNELGMERNRTYDLSVALAVGPQKLRNFRNSATVAELLNVVTKLRLLSYDFFGNWGDTVGFNTALTTPHLSSLPIDDFALSSALVFSQGQEQDGLSNFPSEVKPQQGGASDILSVNKILNILSQDHSVYDRSKISLGVPFYGRTHGFTSEQDASRLPGASKIARGSSRYTLEPGIVSYFDLFQNYLGENGRGINGWEPYYYPEYEAGLVWNRSTGEVISYAPPRTMKAFVALVNQHGLGGVFSWGIDEGNGMLLNAIHEAYGHGQTSFPPPVKRWIYAPLCKNDELSKYLGNGADLSGLVFNNGIHVYQIDGLVSACPDKDEQVPSIGWRRIGSVRDFELPPSLNNGK